MRIVLLLGLGGFALAGLTLGARHNAGLSFGLVALLLAVVVVLASLEGLYLWHRYRNSAQALRILDDGQLALDTGPHEGVYRLAADSLLWPGLLILRLRLADAVDHSRWFARAWSRPLEIVMLTAGLNADSRRALARLLLWAQRKGIAGSRTEVNGPEHNKPALPSLKN